MGEIIKGGKIPKEGGVIQEEEIGIIKKNLSIIIIIFIILFLGFLFFYFDYFPEECNDMNCYQNALLKCEKAFFVREEENYVWRYDILSESDRGSCNVKVRLLKIKSGDINSEILKDKEMICKVYKLDIIFPEKDMTKCSGTLRESLQEIIISRLHDYILQNLGEIAEAIGKI